MSRALKSVAAGIYPKTDVRCTLPDATSFHNLGVIHSGTFWDATHNYLGSRIAESDIVVVECSPRYSMKSLSSDYSRNYYPWLMDSVEESRN